MAKFVRVKLITRNVYLCIYASHGSLIFWSNPLAKPNAIAEYSPFLRDQIGMSRWLRKERANGGFMH